MCYITCCRPQTASATTSSYLFVTLGFNMRMVSAMSLRATLTALLLRGVLGVEQSSSLSLPSELYSSTIGSKIFAIAEKEPAPPLYPQYTDRTQGTWQYFDPNTTWTTGFFPATLYAMHTRQTLCPSESDETDWVSLGRSWSTGIIPFETHNDLQHDVGFVSFPFQEELQMCVHHNSQPCMS